MAASRPERTKMTETDEWVEKIAAALDARTGKWTTHADLLEKLYGNDNPVAKALRMCIADLSHPIASLRSGE
jgi:hypothetical protein